MQNRYDPSCFLTKHTGEAHSESEGSITPAVSISSMMPFSASPAESDGRRGNCLMYRCDYLTYLYRALKVNSNLSRLNQSQKCLHAYANFPEIADQQQLFATVASYSKLTWTGKGLSASFSVIC